METEHTLWERLFEGHQATCLVVSHRRKALRRADQIYVLKAGRLEAVGNLDELLVSCEEMQRLWQGDFEGERRKAKYKRPGFGVRGPGKSKGVLPYAPTKIPEPRNPNPDH